MLRLAKKSIRSAKHRVRVPADVAIRRKQDEVERATMTAHVRHRASEATRTRNLGVPIKPIEMWELFDSRSTPRDAEEVRAGREGERSHGAGWGSWSRGKLFFRTRKSWLDTMRVILKFNLTILALLGGIYTIGSIEDKCIDNESCNIAERVQQASATAQTDARKLEEYIATARRSTLASSIHEQKKAR